jgi:hypothetical protein
MKMYIYKFEEAGVIDWICAPNIKEAIGIYEGDPNSAVISRLKKEELKDSYIIDPNESEPDWDEYDGEDTEDDYCDGYKIIESMEEYLKTAKHTELVSSTNF